MIDKIENLVKTYKNGVRALDKLNFQVREGEIFGLLGPNGSGKTTAINCLLALLNYEEGNIEVFGQEMKPTSYELKRDIGVVSQNVAVFEELTVYENIDYFCGLYVNDKILRKKLVQEVIDFVSINDFRKFFPKKLSGGLLRRLHIACGIAHKPKLIIFDEPTVGVDPQSRNKILEGIKKLNEEGATIIYTTHYMEEVEELCDYIIIMDKGSVIREGTKFELIDSINIGEINEIELDSHPLELLEDIKELTNVLSAGYENRLLIVKSGKGKSNLIDILDLIKKHNLEFIRMHSKLPTLNDVFLEITGKELRD
ncbi:MAG TPA: ABC transporter ATP-binding protein [Acholeplasmataceae bacterium]|nr:ABC transporter ATP-binding protein [Acholeplasmataceae bacterium]